jgi:hypothetical protein
VRAAIGLAADFVLGVSDRNALGNQEHDVGVESARFSFEITQAFRGGDVS